MAESEPTEDQLRELERPRFVDRLFAPKAGSVEAVRSIHGTDPDPPELDGTDVPDFDGGVRETAAEPDPVEDHNKAVVEYVRVLRAQGEW